MTKVDWGKLQHAYGDAADIPSLLFKARSATAGGSDRDEPWFSLWSALCHQGDVYTASYAAVPELVAIAHSRMADHAAARECVLLAGIIELERATPQGHPPPSIPAELEDRYLAALDDGAKLALSLKSRESNADYARQLDVVVAALGLLGGGAVAGRISRLEEMNRIGSGDAD